MTEHNSSTGANSELLQWESSELANFVRSAWWSEVLAASCFFHLSSHMSCLLWRLKMFPSQSHLLTLTFMVLVSNKPLALLNLSLHLFSGELKTEQKLFTGKGHILIQVVSPAPITHNRISVNNLGRIE